MGLTESFRPLSYRQVERVHFGAPFTVADPLEVRQFVGGRWFETGIQEENARRQGQVGTALRPVVHVRLGERRQRRETIALCVDKR